MAFPSEFSIIELVRRPANDFLWACGSSSIRKWQIPLCSFHFEKESTYDTNNTEKSATTQSTAEKAREAEKERENVDSWAPNANEWMSSCEFILVDFFLFRFSLCKAKLIQKSEKEKRLKGMSQRERESVFWFSGKRFSRFSSNASVDGENKKEYVKYYSNIYLSRTLLKPYFLRIISPSSSSVLVRFVRLTGIRLVSVCGLRYGYVTLFFCLRSSIFPGRWFLFFCTSVGIACTHRSIVISFQFSKFYVPKEWCEWKRRARICHF